MIDWPKKVVSWRLGKNLYLSIPFTWLLKEARMMALQHKQGPVFAGGPAVALMPEYLDDVTDIKTPCPIPPLSMHNPLATFTTRGCTRRCSFCPVSKIEGELREIKNWPVRPIVCDSNLLAASRRHFDNTIDRLKALPFVDFNQGLDARLFKRHHASRISELKQIKIRFSFDHIKYETQVYDAIQLARSEGLRDTNCYVLIGFNDTPEDALYRLRKVIEWKALPYPQRYIPSNAIQRYDYVSPEWTKDELRRMVRYFYKYRFLKDTPYEDYRPPSEEEMKGFFHDR